MTALAGRAGLFGKLPARGDFVRSGLPGSFVTPWDTWLSTMLAGSREKLGTNWLPAWLEAPVWRFALAPGLCGEDGVLGVLLPSVDRVGRYFPLTLAALVTPRMARRGLAGCEGTAARDWLDGAEAAGRAALEQDAAPEQVAALLPLLTSALLSDDLLPQAGSRWWTDGGPRVAPAQFDHPVLPDAKDFAAMLSDRATNDRLAPEQTPAEPAS